MIMPLPSAQAELAAIRIILQNVVAHLVTIQSDDPDQIRLRLAKMKDDCKIAAEHLMIGGSDRTNIVNEMVQTIDDLFNNITIAPR
jgi:hypothetical protein